MSEATVNVSNAQQSRAGTQRVVQTYDNHARLVPAYHFGVFGIFLLNLLWSTYRAAIAPSMETAIGILLAIAFLLVFYYARVFPLTVQDRVIRLEMRLRLREVLPPALHSRIPEFTVDQLVALRFASDGELPNLCAQILAEKQGDRRSIKKMVKDWQPDFLRA
ncbi:MAG TPA: DUF6526 family protein [Vicinamibacterales bacterium]|nr:DUF6526 family protein [Vicinamibacterales bacterium]